ncbi:MAG: hypothetical protein AB1490_26350 [Pseudomonadota bacterium]
MRVFLFRNSVNPIEYCATYNRLGDSLPSPGEKARWQFHAEIQNAMHAAVHGMLNYEIAVRSVIRRGYYQYTEPRMLRLAG